ncbi:MAG: serine hydrolase domain-containing protein, partial [Planctomycetota bacterium]
GPLGMEHSGTSTELLTNNPMASKGYQWDPMLERHLAKRVRPISSCAPAGAINSSVLDMTHWIRFQLAKGEYAGQRLLAAERFDEMRAPQVIMGPGVGYGLGWMLRQWKDRNIVEHGGNIDGFAAQVTLVPEEDLGYVLLANVTGAALQQGSIEIVLSSLLEEPKPVVAAWPEEQLQPYLGDYYLEALKANVTVNIDGGKLAIDIPGQTNFKMHWPNDAGHWVFELTDTIELSFAEAVDGQVPELTVHQAGMEMKAKRASADSGPDVGISLEEVLALAKKGFGEADASAYRIIGRTHMKHQGASGDFEMIVSTDQRFRRVADFGKFGRMETCFDGEDVWSRQPGRPVEKLLGVEREAAFAENILLLATCDWNALFEKLELRESTEVDGEAVFVIEGKPAHLPASKFYVSQDSGRIVHIDQGIIAAGIQTMTLRVEQGDFRQVGNLTLPFSSQSMHDATGLIENRVWSIEPYQVDDSTFVISEN